jgi:hypothetical protein
VQRAPACARLAIVWRARTQEAQLLGLAALPLDSDILRIVGKQIVCVSLSR